MVVSYKNEKITVNLNMFLNNRRNLEAKFYKDVKNN